MQITQEVAAEWLAIPVPAKRTLNKFSVKGYASDMAGGRWRPEVAPAILRDANTGGVLDGRHRLTALTLQPNGFVLESDVRFIGVEDMVVVDTGKPRTLVDTLEIAGTPKNLAVAQSAMLTISTLWGARNRVSSFMSRTDQVAWLRQNPNTTAASDFARRMTSKASTGVVRLPIGVTATLWDMADFGYGTDTVEEFVSVFQAGQHHSDVLRRATVTLLDASNRASKTTLTGDARSYLTARIYLAWANDEQPQKLYARPSIVTELPGFREWHVARWGHLAKAGAAPATE